MIRVRVYRTPDGKRPFDDWFQGLDHLAIIKINRAITQIKHGNFSDSRSVGSGVMERRVHYGPGYRIYYGRVGHELVLLLAGGTKRRQQTDIRRARVYWQEFKSSKRRNG